MRLAVAALFVLVFANVHAAAPTAATAPTVDPPKVPTAKTRALQNVNVVKFPDVQAVSGTVCVDKFPDVQTVGGTVNVGNLPLTGDGSVRVKCGQSGVTYDLLDGVFPLSPGSEWISAWVPSAEFRKVTVVSDIGDYVSCLLEWRYLPNDVRTWDNGPRWGYAYGSENAASGEVVGPEFRARCSSSDYDAHVADVRVYLRN